jgi:hypothetical protein
MVIQNVITYNILDIKQDRWGESPEITCQWKYQEPVKNELESSLVSEYNYSSFEECVETEGENMRERAKTRYAYDMSQALAMLLIAIPVWAYHWTLIRREEK